METATLNLTRKWRSKNFDQIVGQELLIKMLKNSLYLGHFFPVYLFSGQRGCGKTSTARVFAAAINCERLSVFQKNPKSQAIPCMECSSCVAMMQGKHPDFFEIDAASHTGVDTIRQIIDAAQLVPLMGSKKIYLIDEAHMLSKASFNALLKILEEPPRSVLFILATTDDQKIIDTVKSRCFQLFFKPIETAPLLEHLSAICQTENIACDTQGLRLIIEHAQGSARDAINVLEQVRFSSSKVNKDAVLKVLGHIDDESLIALLDIVLYKSPADLLQFLASINSESCAADYIWQRFTQLARAALWLKHGVQPKEFTQHADIIKRIIERCSWANLNDLLELLYDNETLFMKTNAKHALLEMILLQLCPKKNTNDGSSGSSSPAYNATALDDIMVEDQESDEDEDDDHPEEEEDSVAANWQQFLANVERLNDPLLKSVFRQGVVTHFDTISSRLDIAFAKELSFFNDWLNDSMTLWMPILKNSFGESVIFNPLFKSEQQVRQQKEVILHKVPEVALVRQPEPKAEMNQTYKQATYSRPTPRFQQPNKPREAIVSVTDAAQWPKAKLMLRYFPGTITEVRN